MALIERDPKVNRGEITSKVNPVNKEPPTKDISEIGKKVEIPISWDSGCRL